jgi:hypothetical protein
VIKITVETRPPIEEFDRLLKRYPRIADKHFNRAHRESGSVIERNWKEIAPVGVSGRYRSTIASKTIGNLGSTVTRIGPSGRIYPAVQEFGRKPGKPPPPGALDRWVERVLGVRGKQVRRVAFLIGRKMKRGWKRTRPPRTPARTAFRLSRDQINKNFRAALRRITRELAGK